MKQKGKMYAKRRNQKHMQQKAGNKAYIDALNKVMIISLSDKNGLVRKWGDFLWARDVSMQLVFVFLCGSQVRTREGI